MRVHTQGQQDSLDNLVRHMGAMSEELLKRNFFRNSAPDTWQPALNVYETDDRYVICVDLAGMDRDKIDVQVGQRVLYIRGWRPKPAVSDSAEEVSVQVMEIDSGRFQRKVPVPADVEMARIEANYRNGYLWIVLPRARDSGETP